MLDLQNKNKFGGIKTIQYLLLTEILHTLFRRCNFLQMRSTRRNTPPQDRPSGWKDIWIHVLQFWLRFTRLDFAFEMFLHFMDLDREVRRRKKRKQNMKHQLTGGRESIS